MQEFWKDIKNYEGLYSISNLGNIWSHYFQKIMKSRICKRNGYKKIGLTKNKKQDTFLVHRLVAIAFLPNPDNKKEVNHKNLDKIDNRVDNLEWVTPLENVNWNRINGKIPQGEDVKNAKLTNDLVLELKLLFKNNPKINVSKLSRETGISRSILVCIKNNKTWKTIKEK